MRVPILAVLAASLVLPGCSKLVSLNPFIAEDQSAVDAGLLGIWTDGANEDIYSVKANRGGYSITCLTKGSVVKLEARMVRAGDAMLLDLVEDSESTQIPAHIPVRVWPEGAALRIAFLDSDWLQAQAEKQIPTQEASGRRVITAPAEAVRNFLLKYGTDERACGKVEILHRAQ